MSALDRFKQWYSIQPTAIRTILTINVVLYFAWNLVLRHIAVADQFVWQQLALSPETVLTHPWQLITYNFLHLGAGLGGILHIGFNMLWLFWLGHDFEATHGSSKMTAVYLLSGIGGGLLTTALYYAFPGTTAFAGHVHGASGAVMGVLAAVATLYPNKSIGLMFIGLVKLKYVVVGLVVIDLLVGFGGGVAVGAHWGGLLFGFMFIKFEEAGLNLTSWTNLFVRKKNPVVRQATRSRRPSPPADPDGSVLEKMETWLQDRRKDEDGSTGFVPKNPNMRAVPKKGNIDPNEVDRILDKISEQGKDSLTREEQDILNKASQQ